MTSRTLFEHMTDWLYQQQRKHDKGDDYVMKEINALSNFEFLERLSEALEKMQGHSV